jgi:hypothetical protein
VYSGFGGSDVVDNFELIACYKGTDSASFENFMRNIGRISLMSNCDDFCGSCFTIGESYLVYASRDFYSGFFNAPYCSRTRRIVDDDFIVRESGEADYGVDERHALLQLGRRIKYRQHLVDFEMSLALERARLRVQLKVMEGQLSTRTQWVYVLASAVVFLLVLFGWYLVWKKRKIGQLKYPKKPS